LLLAGGYSQQSNEFSIVSYGLYKHFRDNTKGFAELSAFSAGGGLLLGVRRSGSVEPAHLSGRTRLRNYFAMFGLRAYAGRTLSTADDQPNAPPAAVMSFRLWRQKYGSDPLVIGSVFNVNDEPFTVVGIALRTFLAIRCAIGLRISFCPSLLSRSSRAPVHGCACRTRTGCT